MSFTIYNILEPNSETPIYNASSIQSVAIEPRGLVPSDGDTLVYSSSSGYFYYAPGGVGGGLTGPTGPNATGPTGPGFTGPTGSQER